MEAHEYWSETLVLPEGDVNWSNEEGVTALQLAASAGAVDVVDMLIQKGAFINKANVYGWTPLIHAAHKGHSKVVQCLLDYGADVNLASRLGLTALAAASFSGKDLTVKLLIEAGANFGALGAFGATYPEDDQDDCSPLLMAAQQGHSYIIQILLDRRHNVNKQTKTLGVTPLMLATLNGHTNAANLLVENGADVTMTNVQGDSARDIAVNQGHVEIKTLLTRHNQRRPKQELLEFPAIIKAVIAGNSTEAQFILSRDPHHMNAASQPDSCPVLVYSVMYSRHDVTDLLLRRGADVNQRDKVYGWTALMMAAFLGQTRTVHQLICFGADPHVTSKSGHTAAVLALLCYEWCEPSVHAILQSAMLGLHTSCDLEISVASTNDASDSCSTVNQSARSSSTSTGYSSNHMDQLSSLDSTYETVEPPLSLGERLRRSMRILSSIGHKRRENSADELSDIQPPPTEAPSVVESCTSRASLCSESLADLVRGLNLSPTVLVKALKLEPGGKVKSLSYQGLESIINRLKIRGHSKQLKLLTCPYISNPSNSKNIVPHPDYMVSRRGWILKPTIFINKLRPPYIVPDELMIFLQHHGLQNYYSKFVEQMVDMEALQLLTEEDLLEIGIDRTLPRDVILHAIGKLPRRAIASYLT